MIRPEHEDPIPAVTVRARLINTLAITGRVISIAEASPDTIQAITTEIIQTT